MVSCINIVSDPSDNSNEFVITGGADKTIKLHILDAKKDLQQVIEYQVPATPRSVDFMDE